MPNNNNTPKKRPPARTPEARERQLIAYAVDLAEKQLREGTASAQVITHYLKLSSSIHELEKEKLARETELLKAKKVALESIKNRDELYAEAIKAMRKYSGSNDSHEKED